MDLSKIIEPNEINTRRVTRINLKNVIKESFDEINKRNSLQFIENVGPGEMLFCGEDAKRIIFKLSEEQTINIIRFRKGTPRAPIYKLQVFLRISMIISNSGVQFENISSHCSVELNGEMLRITEKMPINLMSFLKLMPDEINTLLITFQTPCLYVINIYLAKPEDMPNVVLESFNPINLLNEKEKNNSWHNLKEKCFEENFTNDEDTLIMSIEVPVICPISKELIRCPCRGEQCFHLNCFDLSSFLRVFLKKRKWNCPICEKLINSNTLFIDRNLQTLIKQLPVGCKKIILNRDGSWIPVTD